MASTKDILEYSKVIAVVGASRDPNKPAHSVPLAMQRRGFRIIPVTPTAAELFGEKAYASLAEVPFRIDLVDVFRPGEDAPGIARQAVAAGARALWLQQGIVSPEARRIAEAGGLDFIEDSCIAVERALHKIVKA